MKPWRHRRPRRHRRKATRLPDPLRAADVLSTWLHARKLDSELLPCFIAQRWRELVGDRIAARTRPAGLRNGELTVEVATSVWLNELNMMRDRLVATIDERLGKMVDELRAIGQTGIGQTGIGRTQVKRLRLVVGRIRHRKQQPAPEPAPVVARASAPLRRRALPPKLAEALANVVDEGLAAAIRRAWSRAQEP